MPDPNEDQTTQTTQTTQGDTQTNAADGTGDSKTGDGEQLYTIKVRGQERQVTKDELVRLAQKNENADQVVQTYTEDHQAWDDFSKARQGDRDAYGRLWRRVGFDSKEQALQYFDAAMASGQDPTGGAAGGDDDDDDGPIPIEKLPPEVQDSMTREKQRYYQEIQQAMMQTLAEALDKDQVLGDIIKQEGPDSPVVTHLREQAYDFLGPYVQSGRKFYEPEVLQNVVQKTRQFAKDMKLMDRPKGEGVVGLGAGPTDLLSTPMAPKEPAKRPSMDDPEYEDKMEAYLSDLLVSKVRKHSAGGR